MTPENLFAGIVFSAIGMGAGLYGWRTQRWKAFIIGASLTIYPYFTGEAWLTTLIGVALTVALFVFRD